MDCCLTCWGVAAAVVAYAYYYFILDESVPELEIPLKEAESQDEISRTTYEVGKDAGDTTRIPCYDPGNMQFLGYVPAMTAKQVHGCIKRARDAQKIWAKSSFKQRRTLLKIFLKYIVDHQEEICRVSARDSGKPMVDAAFGEVIVTCEKIKWLCSEGEKWLKPEKRSSGIMMFYKAARVEFHPVGVMGAIVPWNYPFHNVFNPLTANLFAGNSMVIKVSEHASWSTDYYGRIIKAALSAAGAPEDLVQIVTGYGEAGNALVTGGIDKLTFVGSTGIGRKVMVAAAERLTPVVLELGGKDAFIVMDDADLGRVVPTALRGAFQSCGQNCAGAERFFVQAKVYDQFVKGVVEGASKIRQGHALGPAMVDCGAMCMPQQAAYVKGLLEDAVKKGAKILVGGKFDPAAGGQFCPPTVIVGVKRGMRILEEEVFGPVLAITKFSKDEDAVKLANDCPFGLGSSVFSRSVKRANAIAAQLQAGMSSINDFATTYMCQSLPFGGVKESGFDRFAGIEGLRGCCIPKAVVEDRVPFLMDTRIPPPLQYPIADVGFSFVSSLVKMFYGNGLAAKVGGIVGLIKCSIPTKKA